MLVTEKVIGMGSVGDLSVEQMKEFVFADFACHLKQEILETEHHKQGLQNYDYFEAEYGKKITYNNKNISYQDVCFDLKEFCGRYFGLKATEVCDGGSNEVTKYRTVFEVPTEDEVYAECQRMHSELPSNYFDNLKKLVDYNRFFGVGKFPYLVFTIIRIGNQDYYFGKITR